MEMLVLGATGSLGRSLTAELVQRGHVVRASSRMERTAAEGPAHWVRVDLRTGEGLRAAIQGADAVIDAANVRSPRRSALDAVLVEGTGRVLDACHGMDDVHYVGISIVGIEQMPYGYYGVKLRQERMIECGPAPWSLLRATQFHELVDQMLRAAARLRVLVLPTAIKAQPIDVTDVARRLADAAERPAAGRLADIGGPRVQTLGELAQEWMRARHRRLRVLSLPLPGRVGKTLATGALCSPQQAIEGRDFAAWLASAPTGGSPS